MSRKTAIWVWMFVISTIGAYIPAIWGEGVFSLSSVFLSGIGGFIGIWIGYRTGN